MDFIKKNASLLITAAIVILVAVFAIASQSNNDQDQGQEQNQEQTQSTEEQTGQPAEPQESSDGVNKTEDTYSTVVARGDNQTVLVRKIVSRYIAENNKTLNAEQKLHAETNLVNTLPRSDLIYAGETISLTNEKIQQIVSESERLTADQQARWARYL